MCEGVRNLKYKKMMLNVQNTIFEKKLHSVKKINTDQNSHHYGINTEWSRAQAKIFRQFFVVSVTGPILYFLILDM